MTHPRRVIRDAIAAHIKGGDTVAGPRVWASREPPIKVESVLIDQGPIALVYTRRDYIADGDYPTAGAGRVRRTVEIAIEVTAVGAETIDDKLDDACEQIEDLMDALAIPGQPSTEIRLKSTDIDTVDEFEMPLGGALMLYEGKYWKDWRLPDEPDWNACGGDIYALPHMNGIRVGDPILVSEGGDCPC